MFRATRRRHGIPDDDNRPFNVAYAAAKQAQRDGKGRLYMKDGPELVAGEEEEEEEETVAAPGALRLAHWHYCGLIGSV